MFDGESTENPTMQVKSRGLKISNLPVVQIQSQEENQQDVFTRLIYFCLKKINLKDRF
jgi:hypothetical protein